MNATTPDVIEDGRHLRAQWPLEVHHDDRGDEVTELAVLTVFHHGRSDIGGRDEYCYTATLDRQQTIDRGGYKIRRQTIGVTYRSSVSVAREDAKRYSAKRCREFFDRSVAEVERRRESGDPDTLAVFGQVPA